MNAWLPCAKPGHLEDTEVHLWLVPLDLISKRLVNGWSMLSDDERQRAERYYRQEDAERYGWARASLRCILGTYLQLAPDRLRFSYDHYRKPHLSRAHHSTSLQFSVSHSAALALLGIVLHRNVGVDLECVRGELEIAELATRFFSRREAEILRSMTGQERLDAFFRCWTRKEAYLKARGQGLSYGLDRVEVTLKPDEPAAILSAADDPHASNHWTLQHLSPAPGYIGAAAVEDQNLTFKSFTWTPDLPHQTEIPKSYTS